MEYRPTFIETLKKSIIVCFGAGVLAMLVNLAIYFFARSMGYWQDGLDADAAKEGVQSIDWKAVMAASVMPGLVSGILFAVLFQWAPKAHWIFWAIAAAVFVLFFGGPLKVAGITEPMKWILEILHVPPAAFILAAINRYFPKK